MDNSERATAVAEAQNAIFEVKNNTSLKGADFLYALAEARFKLYRSTGEPERRDLAVDTYAVAARAYRARGSEAEATLCERIVRLASMGVL